MAAFYSCHKTDYTPTPQVISKFHNALGAGIQINIFGIQSLPPGKYTSINGQPLFYFGYRPIFENVIITFSDGSKKIDFDCASFPVNSPYYLLCKEDTVSVFLKSNYWQEVQGIDTIYHYFIGEKDSLEAF